MSDNEKGFQGLGLMINKEDTSPKTNILWILRTLREHSDENNKLRLKDISEILKDEYGRSIDTKTISRNIDALIEAGYEIEKGRGTYFNDRLFDDSELHMIIDGILSSKYIDADHSADLIDRLCSIATRTFASNIEHIELVDQMNKTENAELFTTIDIINKAIRDNCQISYDYNKYGVDKKLHRTSSQKVTPYWMFLNNQRYYLMGYCEHWGDMVFHRMDHISNVRIIDDEPGKDIRIIPGYENGINFKELSTALPYMYNDKPVNVAFIADKEIVDQIVDWFGNNALINECADNPDKVRVNVKVSENAMEHWAMQYLNFVEITAPLSLRNRLQDNLKKGLDKYK